MSKLYIHTSDRNTFKRCRQQWDFSSSLRMDLEPLRPAKPLWFGTGFHNALEVYYAPDSPRDPLAALAVWDDYCMKERKRFVDEEGELWLEEEEEFNASEELGRAMLKHYCSEFAPAVDDFSVVLIEPEFYVPLFKSGSGYEVVYSFRLDGLVKDKDGRLWILEHKTANKINDRRWLAMDEQCGSYIWAIQKVMGVEVEGVIYNTIVKKAPHPLRTLKNGDLSVDKQQVTTYTIAHKQLKEMYGDNIPQKYQDYLEFLIERERTDNPFFKREKIRRNRKEIERLGEVILREAHEMTNPDIFIYRSPGPFTCNMCAFYDPCVARWESGDDEFLLKSLYRKRRYHDDA